MSQLSKDGCLFTLVLPAPGIDEWGTVAPLDISIPPISTFRIIRSMVGKLLIQFDGSPSSTIAVYYVHTDASGSGMRAGLYETEKCGVRTRVHPTYAMETCFFEFDQKE